MADGVADMTSMALLPEGLRDTLPPFAEAESGLLRAMLDTLARNGFERVSPPLIEYDETLDAALDGSKRFERFRFMDPASQRLLAVRQDMTGQIARLAATRLAHWARPLRLCYSGPVLRVRGTQLQADRQFLQLGAELIGSDNADAITEVIALALESMRAVGLGVIGVDLVMPGFAEQLMQGFDPMQRARVLDALDAKDAGALAALNVGPRFETLLMAAGAAPDVLANLATMALEPAAQAQLSLVRDVIARLGSENLSLDPCERRGFEFQTGIGFSLFAPGVRGEIGRGGCYHVRYANGASEAAVGFSLYIDSLIEAGIGGSARPRVLVRRGLAAAALSALHAQGYATVLAHGDGPLPDQAAAQRCVAFEHKGALEFLKG
jgi:ATP phosphoribosyltransferase regulatory subunit